MNIAFIGHPYHRKTRSSDFFIDTLNTRDETTLVRFYDDDVAPGQNSPLLEQLIDEDFDLYITWQTEYLAPPLIKAGKRAIAIPMYDAARQHDPSFWHDLTIVPVVCFCRHLHNVLQSKHLNTRYYQYFPEVDNLSEVDSARELSGFAWIRRPWDGLDAKTAIKLAKQLKLNQLHIHNSIDEDPSTPDKTFNIPRSRINISTTQWCDSRQEYLDLVQQHPVFFAPRYYEGIGFSFLEAMAMGRCVIGADLPTLNEYITHGENGWLFEPFTKPSISGLSLEQAREMGRAARQSMAEGRKRWQADVAGLLDFVLHQNVRNHTLPPKLTRTPKEPVEQPALSIVTVVKNDPEGLRKTIASIADQQAGNFEYLVADGGSDEPTLQVIAQHKDVIDTYSSQQDSGPYHAMQAAAEIARGKYILFMNAGDHFFASDSVSLLLENIPANADIVVGDHIWVTAKGEQVLRHAREFETTWSELQTGELSLTWLDGIPCHQSTMTKTSLLRKHHYDLRFQIAADHEFLFRMRALGAQVHHCGATISVYYQGGMSSLHEQRCQAEWRSLAKLHSDNPEVDKFYGIVTPELLSSPIPMRVGNTLANKLRNTPLYAPARLVWRMFKKLKLVRTLEH